MLPSKKLGRTGLMVSPVALGTVELGYTYGIGPRNLPNEKEAISLLQEAVDMGVNFFDTAHFYGCAEERIGKSGIAQIPGIIIATKCGHNIEKKQNITAAELEREIRQEVDESRKVLKMDTLDLVLIHGGTAEQIQKGMLITIMQKLKDEHKVAHCGISTRGIDAPQAAIDSGFFEVLQVGYSIFDQRLRPILLKASAKEIGIIARSVLLKGALTPAHRFLTDELAMLKKYYAEISDIAQKMGTDVPTLALRFAFTENALSTILIGTNKKENLELAFTAYNKGSLAPDILEALKKFAIDDPALVDPAHWPATAVSDEKDGQKVIPHLRGRRDT